MIKLPPLNRLRILAGMLRLVAQKHDEQRYSCDRRYNESGICLACEFVADDYCQETGANWRDTSHCRDDIDRVLRHMQEGYGAHAFLNPFPHGAQWHEWNQRATMCLLMAEWIEDRIKELS